MIWAYELVYNSHIKVYNTLYYTSGKELYHTFGVQPRFFAMCDDFYYTVYNTKYCLSIKIKIKIA